MSARLLIVAVLAALGACTSPPASTPTSTPTPIPSIPSRDTPQGIAVGPPSAFSFQALLRGRLAMQDGCLVVEDGTTPPVVPVFVEGTISWSGEGEIEFKGAKYRIGDAVVLTGGYSEQIVASVVSIPPGCPPGNYFIVANEE